MITELRKPLLETRFENGKRIVPGQKKYILGAWFS